MTIIALFLPVAQPTTTTKPTAELPVIMYHHISENNSLLNDYVITPEEFENDIKYLSDNGYHTITSSQLINGEFPEKAVMITFDDGFLSTYKYAKPILEKYNMTGVCAIIGSVMTEYTEHPNTVSDCAYMNTETVREMLTSGTFEIACHTFDMHRIGTRKGCSKISWESNEDYKTALSTDLTQFNDLYVKSFGTTTNIIAFPYGEYSDKTIETAVNMGYKVMLTCDEKINHISFEQTEPIILGRFNRPHGKSTDEFFKSVLNKSSK